MDAYFIGLTFSSKIFKQTDAGSRLFIKEGRSMTDKPCRSVCISAPGYSGRLCARDRIFGKNQTTLPRCEISPGSAYRTQRDISERTTFFYTFQINGFMLNFEGRLSPYRLGLISDADLIKTRPHRRMSLHTRERPLFYL
jgi:hypothetical protein